MNSGTAVLLTRAQPFTAAHEGLLKVMLSEHKNVCIVIGSADKSGTERNPFDIKLRLAFVKAVLEERLIEKERERVVLFPLKDWEDENNKITLKEWGSYLYYNIVSRIKTKEIVFYYSDGEETLQEWFNSEVKQHVTYRLFDRTKEFDGISATKLRKAMIEGDEDYIKLASPSVGKNCLKYMKCVRNMRSCIVGLEKRRRQETYWKISELIRDNLVFAYHTVGTLMDDIGHHHSFEGVLEEFINNPGIVYLSEEDRKMYSEQELRVLDKARGIEDGSNQKR